MPEFVLKDSKIIQNCKDEIDRSYGMEVIIRKKLRSDKSNRYYFNILELIGKEIGYSKEDLHDLLKLRVLGPKHITVAGETITIPKRSSDLEQGDFGKLVDAAIMLAASQNVKIPAPPYYGL